MQEQLRVFVSSVMAAEDLSAERDNTVRAIQSLRLTKPWAFEYAPAEPNPASEVYLREVRNSDILILIVSQTHSDAVQRELEAAEASSIAILAFVRRLPGSLLETTERVRVIEWLRDRVKYEYFSDATDLAEKVTTATVAELVRGYKQYRIQRQDLRTLLGRVAPPPSLLLRAPHPHEGDSIRTALTELSDWYPNIGAWIDSHTKDIDASTTVRIADIAGEIAGLSLSRDKEPGVRKFSTIYVRPGFRGEAIGPHLVYEEVKRAAADGVRKAYVTFANELLAPVGPILGRYGFVFEGVAPSRYRSGVAEWVMGKVFTRQQVKLSGFQSFVMQHFVEEVGGRTLYQRGSAFGVRLPSQPLFGLPAAKELQLVLSTSPLPEDDYEKWKNEIGDDQWLFLSIYGRPADQSHWSHQVLNWIDGEDLRARFYPVEFERPEEPSLICTIRPSYADALIPRGAHPSLLPPDRLQIRPDNVYYRIPDRYQMLRRGSRIFFYVSAPQKNLRGVARIQRLKVDIPEECLAEFGSMGILQFDDLARIARPPAGRVLAIAFDWYREYTHQHSLAEVHGIVANYNAVSAHRVSWREAESLMGLA